LTEADWRWLVQRSSDMKSWSACTLSTSLGIHGFSRWAALASMVDLYGPLLLAKDGRMAFGLKSGRNFNPQKARA